MFIKIRRNQLVFNASIKNVTKFVNTYSIISNFPSLRLCPKYTTLSIRHPLPLPQLYLTNYRINSTNEALYFIKLFGTRSSGCLQSVSHENTQNTQSNTKNLEQAEDETSDIEEGSWQEVYNGVLTTQLKLLKMFSIGTSIIGLSVQPMLYEKLGTTDLAIVVTLASIFGVFTFITPALIHWVSKKYVTKLEYHPESDSYVATTLSFFLKEKKLHFKLDDVIRPDIPGMFTSFLVKNKPLFVDPSLFDNLDHYSRIMGFNKPIDFSLDADKPQKK